MIIPVKMIITLFSPVIKSLIVATAIKTLIAVIEPAIETLIEPATLRHSHLWPVGIEVAAVTLPVKIIAQVRPLFIQHHFVTAVKIITLVHIRELT